MIVPHTFFGGLIFAIKQRREAAKARNERRAQLLEQRKTACYILRAIERGDDVARLEKEIKDIDEELRTL